MTKVFTVEILLENDQMQTGDDVAAVLRNLVPAVAGREFSEVGLESHILRDTNGNRVGSWGTSYL